MFNKQKLDNSTKKPSLQASTRINPQSTNKTKQTTLPQTPRISNAAVTPRTQGLNTNRNLNAAAAGNTVKTLEHVYTDVDSKIVNVSSTVQSVRIMDLNKLLQEMHNFKNSPFEDHYFQKSGDSLSSDFKNNENITWLRPIEIIADPERPILGVNGEISQPVQKQLGDCWFVSACYALFAHERNSLGSVLLKHVIKPNENNENLLNGLIKVTFYVNGTHLPTTKYLSVCIDDKLPVKVNSKQLIYGACSANTSFWFPLLEKAYAKLYGYNYENIVSGVPEEAFIDLCGAFTLYLNPKNDEDLDLILEKLNSLKAKKQLIAVADTIPMRLGHVAQSSLNAPKSHSFIIIDVCPALVQSNTVIKLKNPWSTVSISKVKELWDVNCNKTAAENTNELHLKLNDFSKYFGAVSMVLGIPNITTNKFHEFNGLFEANNQFSFQEAKDKQYFLKNTFISYLVKRSQFYLLEVEQKVEAAAEEIEVLFNLTQYRTRNSTKQHNKLRLSIIEVNETNPNNLKANYSYRFESNRTGRTLSKLFKINPKKRKYLICLMNLSNEVDSKENLDRSDITYLFRAMLINESSNISFNLQKCSENLTVEDIKLDINSCSQCDKVLLSELNNSKIYKVDKSVLYCSDCYANRFFKSAIHNFNTLLTDYSDVN